MQCSANTEGQPTRRTRHPCGSIAFHRSAGAVAARAFKLAGRCSQTRMDARQLVSQSCQLVGCAQILQLNQSSMSDDSLGSLFHLRQRGPSLLRLHKSAEELS